MFVYVWYRKSFSLGKCILLLHTNKVLPDTMKHAATLNKVNQFWFGEKAFKTGKTALSSSEYGQANMMRWYMGGKDMDEACQAAFPLETVTQTYQEFVQLQAKDSFSSISREERLGGIVLFDQVVRNAFRGTEEAFKWGHMAEAISLASIDQKDHLEMGWAPLSFILTPLMHSETLAMHELFVQELDKAVEVYSGLVTKEQTEYLLMFELEHKKVIERFGHYPHRNGIMGRETTEEEAAWLDSEEAPMWTKSQTKRSNYVI